MDPLSAEALTRLKEYGTSLGLDLYVVNIDSESVSSDCRVGSSTDTDVSSQGQEQFRTIIGALCGCLERGRICVLIFRKRAALDKFRKSNPKVSGTLITWWPRIVLLWLRVNGNVPPNMNLVQFSWCSEGVVPIGVPELPVGHFISQAGAIAVVDFQELHWEELPREAIEVELLQQKVGARYLRTSRATVLNVRFWSQYLAKKFNLNYDLSTRKFQLKMIDPQGTVSLSEAEMVNAVFDCLQDIARVDPDFPQKALRLARAEEMVRMMKGRVARPAVSESELVDRWVEKEIERQTGGMVTGKQLWERFLASHRIDNRPLCPEVVFYRLLREKIRRYFGIGQSHDRRHTNGNPRFYRNLALRPPGVVVVEVKDAATAHLHALFGTTSCYEQPTFGRCAE
jgi:hypothetical protein